MTAPLSTDLVNIKDRVERVAAATCESIEFKRGVRAYWRWVSDRELRIFEHGEKPIMSVHVEDLQ